MYNVQFFFSQSEDIPVSITIATEIQQFILFRKTWLHDMEKQNLENKQDI